jgi:hypothetical protein
LRGLLVPGSSETHGWFALPSVRPFAACRHPGAGANLAPAGAAPLLWPLLTSRSASWRRRPFRREARPPQVRMVMFPAQPPDLRRSPLVARVRGHPSASPGSRRLLSVAPPLLLERVLPVRRLAVSAPRFFQRRPRDRTGCPASSPCGSLEVAATSSLQDFHPFITSMLGTRIAPAALDRIPTHPKSPAQDSPCRRPLDPRWLPGCGGGGKRFGWEKSASFVTIWQEQDKLVQHRAAPDPHRMKLIACVERDAGTRSITLWCTKPES